VIHIKSETANQERDAPDLVTFDLPFPTSLTAVAGPIPGDLLLLRRQRTSIHVDRFGFGWEC
jgi:hypothetical protein